MALRILLLFSFISSVLMANDTGPREYEYCHKKLCTLPNKSHIACNNVAEFPKDCNNSKIIYIGKDLRHLILVKHNNLRSRLAMGLHQYIGASQMATMRWSQELAYLAELNVRRCYMKRSECTSTAEYPNIGQNTAYNKIRGEEREKDIISSQISMWFDEYEKADMSSIEKEKIPKRVKHLGEIKHFLQMARDRADRIGCAIAKYTDANGYTIQHMTCLYNVGVDNCYPIYSSSEIGGNHCQTGINRHYPFLCNEEEEYNYILCPKIQKRSKHQQKSKCSPKTYSENSLLNNIYEWYVSVGNKEKKKENC